METSRSDAGLPAEINNNNPIYKPEHGGPEHGKAMADISAAKHVIVMPHVVAVVGCDGSGKTRLVKDIVATLQKTGRAERWYMGLVSGEAGDKIKELPLIGVRLEHYLASKVRRAQDMKKKVPGPATAIVMYLFSRWRERRMRLLKKRSESGVLVIAERFPQAEIAGFHYDGPGIAVERSSSRLVRNIARREQRLYERITVLRPALIIRLTIDPDTAYARKPDHPLAELRDKTSLMPLIHYNGAPIFEIDSCLPYETVLSTALNAIDKAIGTV